MGAIVGLTIFVGFLSSVLLQRIEFLSRSMAMRYGVSCLVAYAAFLLIVRWWIRYVAGIREAVGDEVADTGRFDLRGATPGEGPSQMDRKGRDRDVGGRGCGDGCSDPGCADIDGLIAFVGLIAIILVIASVFTYGPLILSEIVADTLLAGGLLRWARRTEMSWMESTWRTTRLPFLAITAAIVLFALWAASRCPTATRFGEIWACL
ncbi:MAG: hypothetical protein ABI672_11950 [Vicinamibacteria bacterium]